MSGPIRGLHDVEGQLYTVSGPTLYRITPAGVAIPLGQIPGVGRVSMAHNQVAGGHQLTIVNGVGGYVWNTANQQFNVITDEGFPGSSRVDFIDGYMMHVEPFGRFLLHSDLADALDFNTLDRFEAETAPDRTTTLIVNGTEVWAFGERTIDVFYNAGTAQGTFQNKKVGITTGCIAGASPAICDGGVAWLGDDRVVYHARGYSPTRISTRALDVVLSECSLSDIRNAFSFVYADRGHTIYYLTIPNGMTFGYDFSTGLWHRRASWHPEKDVYGRWCLSDLVRSNGKWIGGDYRTGKLYALDWEYPLEGCEPLIRERTSPVLHNDGNRVEVHEIQPIFDTGRASVECVPFPYQPVGPQISGRAPDGLSSDPYSFAYTVQQGSAPVTRVELRDTELPTGWVWDSQTATISHAASVPKGSVTLKMRAYDANGLFADHTDDFVINEAIMLLVTGASKTGDTGSLWAAALALEPLQWIGLERSDGADLPRPATPAYFDGRFGVVGGSGVRHSHDPGAAWASGAENVNTSKVMLAMGGAGWLVKEEGSTTDSRHVMQAPDPDTALADVTYQMNSTLCRYVEGKYYLGWAYFLAESEDMVSWSLAYDDFGSYEVINFYDLVKHGDLYYAIYDASYQFEERRVRIGRSADLSDWTPILDMPPQSYTNRPLQLASNGEKLLAYCENGFVRSLDDNFASAVHCGLEGPSVGNTVLSLAVPGRKMVSAGGRFVIIGGGDDSGRAVSTSDGITFSEPSELPITNSYGITAGVAGEAE